MEIDNTFSFDASVRGRKKMGFNIIESFNNLSLSEKMGALGLCIGVGTLLGVSVSQQNLERPKTTQSPLETTIIPETTQSPTTAPSTFKFPDATISDNINTPSASLKTPSSIAPTTVKIPKDGITSGSTSRPNDVTTGNSTTKFSDATTSKSTTSSTTAPNTATEPNVDITPSSTRTPNGLPTPSSTAPNDTTNFGSTTTPDSFGVPNGLPTPSSAPNDTTNFGSTTTPDSFANS